MIGIIGQKLGMTQVFNDQGQQIPVTVVEAPPNPVLGFTEKAKAGFASVQLGYGKQRTARESKKGEGKPRGRRATQADVPAGDGSAGPVGLIAMDKYLPGQGPTGTGSGAGNEAGQDLSVAR